MSNKNVLEDNKALVCQFYELALNQRNFDAASRCLGSYKQHNPLIEDGAEGLKKYLAWIKENFPNSHSKVLRVFGEGDAVILHVHRVRTPGMRGRRHRRSVPRSGRKDRGTLGRDTADT